MTESTYIVQFQNKAVHAKKMFCNLVENQVLVDLTIICNAFSMKVHKCILAASSIFFREHLQRDFSIDRVIINNMREPVLKALVEYIYCGETTLSETFFMELISAAKFLGIDGLHSVNINKLPNESITGIPPQFNLFEKPPLFFSKNSKITNLTPGFEQYYNDKQAKGKPKISDEVYYALVKEEEASRQALEMLQKDLVKPLEVFVVDEGLSEATVETSITPDCTDNILFEEYVPEKNDNGTAVQERQHRRRYKRHKRYHYNHNHQINQEFCEQQDQSQDYYQDQDEDEDDEQILLIQDKEEQLKPLQISTHNEFLNQNNHSLDLPNFDFLYEENNNISSINDTLLNDLAAEEIVDSTSDLIPTEFYDDKTTKWKSKDTFLKTEETEGIN